jgi:hypothetical protein
MMANGPGAGKGAFGALRPLRAEPFAPKLRVWSYLRLQRAVLAVIISEQVR